ncbi:MAG: DUF1579 domain-containing protein [Bacteroidota bacterium]
MKKINITCLALSVLILLSCGNADKTKEETAAPHDSVATAAPEETKEKPPVDSATAAKAWEAYMTPGDMHKWMAMSDGKWDAEMTFWMGPDAKAMPGGTSKVENKMVLGGRYQVTEYKGKMMGMDYEGHGTMAYDNAKKKFINTWIDNTGTGLMYMEGAYDEPTKTINFTGKMVDPNTGEDCDMRQAFKAIDDKNQLLEMYTTKDGKEFKSMEIKFTKK